MKRFLGIVLALTLAVTAAWAAGENRYSHDLYYEDNIVVNFGTDLDFFFKFDGTKLVLDCATDDTEWAIGDGTTSIDIDLFGNSTALYISWDASASDLKFEDSVSLMFGTGTAAGQGAAGDVEMRWDATDFDVLAAADDQVWKFGNGTNSWDIWIYGNTASDYLLFDASANLLSSQGAYNIAPKYLVTAKTGNYTITSADFGQVFTTRGAGGAVTFTLPAASGNAGAWVRFLNAVDQNMAVAGTAGELILFNDAAANSATFSTAGEKIGAAIYAFCDGTSWFIAPEIFEAVTITVAT